MGLRGDLGVIAFRVYRRLTSLSSQQTLILQLVVVRLVVAAAAVAAAVAVAVAVAEAVAVAVAIVAAAGGTGRGEGGGGVSHNTILHVRKAKQRACWVELGHVSSTSAKRAYPAPNKYGSARGTLQDYRPFKRGLHGRAASKCIMLILQRCFGATSVARGLRTQSG